MLPLQHDTPDELAQPEVQRLEARARSRQSREDHAQVPHGGARLCPPLRAHGSAGRGVEKNGVSAHGLTIPVADEYQELAAAPTAAGSTAMSPIAGDGARSGRGHPGARPGLQRRAGPPRLRGRRAQDRPAADRSGRRHCADVRYQLRRYRGPAAAGADHAHLVRQCQQGPRLFAVHAQRRTR